jgi:glycosyltransferase involved in cell wall biosynthesis
MGPSVATEMIIESELNDKFNLVHLDTADRRSLTNIGKIDFGNIFLAFVHFIKLISLLIKFSPRIVYLPICQTIRGYLRDVFFMLVSKVFGARIIIHLRGGFFRELYEKSNILAKVIIKLSLEYVSRAIVLGNNLKYIFEGLVPSDLIDVVPNGIDENYITEADFLEAHRKKIMVQTQGNPIPKSLSKKRILFLSNLILSKGYFDIIQAIPEVIKKNKNVEFYFAGARRGSRIQNNSVAEFINEYNLRHRIIFTDTILDEEKKKLLLSSDIFVMPTYYQYEGQPWVIIEAMSAGLPILSTDHGAIKEMVIDGENGFIVRKQSPEDIAQKIIALLQNNGLRKKMGMKSRELFLKKFTEKQFVDGLESVFNLVVDEKKAV